MQANLQRGKLALIIEADKAKITFALVQELYLGGEGVVRQYPGVRIIQSVGRDTKDKTVKTAVLLFDNKIDVTQYLELTTKNIAVAKLRTGSWEIRVMSIYLEADKLTEPYMDKVRAALEDLGMRDAIVGGFAGRDSLSTRGGAAGRPTGEGSS